MHVQLKSEEEALPRKQLKPAKAPSHVALQTKTVKKTNKRTAAAVPKEAKQSKPQEQEKAPAKGKGEQASKRSRGPVQSVSKKSTEQEEPAQPVKRGRHH